MAQSDSGYAYRFARHRHVRGRTSASMAYCNAISVSPRRTGTTLRIAGAAQVTCVSKNTNTVNYFEGGGISGGLCWGDSGGPIYEPSGGSVSAILADFVLGVQCNCGLTDAPAMHFTKLSVHKSLICDGADYVGTGRFRSRSMSAEFMAIAPS